MTPDQPTATTTPRTDANSRNATQWNIPQATRSDPVWEAVPANFARTLERELSSAQAELAEAKADNESLRTLWTEIRTVLIQSRAANCVCSYGAQQADAVEAANAVLKRMPPDVTNERDQLRARVAELEAELKATRKQANDEFDAVITRNMELGTDNFRLINKVNAQAVELHKLEADKALLAEIADKWITQYYETSEGFDPEEAEEYKADRAAIDAARKGQP